MIYLSVVVPVRNEGRFIAHTLAMLAAQDYPRDRYEIVVVDGQSTDSTRVEVERFGRDNPDVQLRLLENSGLLSSRGRNIGIRAARGRLIAVIDGHVFIPGTALLKDMEDLATTHKALCLARPAPLDVPGLSGGKAYWIAVARKSWIGHSRVSHIYSGGEGFVDPVSSGFAYDRSVFEEVGYFDEVFDAAEDVEFHHRLKKMGISAYTSPKFLIYSYPRESIGALFRQQVRYGEGRARFVRKHPEGLSKETLVPPALFCAFMGSPLAVATVTRLPVVSALYLAPLLVYVLVLAGTGLAEAAKRGSVFPGFLVAMAIGVTHAGLGWGFIKGMARPVTDE